MASRIGETAKAYRYFMDTALMDLTDLKNVVDGIHAANMEAAGKFDLWFCWSFIMMKASACPITYQKEITELAFKLFIREELRITLKEGKVECQLAPETELFIEQTGKDIWVRKTSKEHLKEGL